MKIKKHFEFLNYKRIIVINQTSCSFMPYPNLVSANQSIISFRLKLGSGNLCRAMSEGDHGQSILPALNSNFIFSGGIPALIIPFSMAATPASWMKSARDISWIYRKECNYIDTRATKTLEFNFILLDFRKFLPENRFSFPLCHPS